MPLLRTFAAAGLMLAAGGPFAAALAAPQVERLRGTIERVEGDAVTIRTRAGTIETVRLGTGPHPTGSAVLPVPRRPRSM